MSERSAHQDHFESRERQASAATLGMCVFLASEVLFFGALFTLYSAYRAESPAAFAKAVRENTLWLGSANTVVLLTSSLLAALAVHRLREGQTRRCLRLVYATALLGMVFVLIKAYEYHLHFQHGIHPGGRGSWFVETAREPGAAAFWTLYFLMTGLHALHLLIGVGVLGVVAWAIKSERVVPQAPQVLENAALYWHLVDIVWLFLWPLFYLTKSYGR